MSRGLGKTQKKIVQYIESEPDTPRTIREIAEEVGISERQCLTAVQSLRKRGLVWMKRHWKGYREELTGQLVGRPKGVKPHWVREDEAPVLTVEAGDPWPLKKGYVATAATDFYRCPVPAGACWVVWSQKHVERFLEEERYWESVRRAVRGW